MIFSRTRCAERFPSLCAGWPKARPGLPGASGAAQGKFSDLRRRNPEILILIVTCLAGRAGRGIRWSTAVVAGTDVRLDPGDEHGGIVPLGTDRNAAVIIMPANPWLMNYQLTFRECWASPLAGMTP